MPGPGSALLSDALDQLGRRVQTLRPGIAPLTVGTVVSGRAVPLTVVACEAAPEEHYVGLLAAMDALAPGDVVVVSGRDPEGPALWGELLSTMAAARGASGVIVDGWVRDIAAMRAMGFPAAARGTVPRDIHGRLEVVDHRSPVEIDGVVVRPGDLVVADDDGVVVVPAELRDEAVAAATEKANAESSLRDDVRAGMAPSEAFARHQVL